MPEITIKLPDIGEGIAEAEISEWMVEVGEWVREDEPLGVVLTDKAAVEIPASASGQLVWRAGEPGDRLAIGAPLVRLNVAEDGEDAPETSAEPTEAAPSPTPPPARSPRQIEHSLAAPAVRQRARNLGLDLSEVEGTGPEGRVTHADLDRRLAGTPRKAPARDGVTETRVIGLRRQIAEQMVRAHERIPQITIVEEVDVTELERLRGQMNADRSETQPRLTLLPFLIRGMIVARSEAPEVNARYNDEAGVLHRHDAVHVGIATQTERGLLVPVLRHAEAQTVWEIAAGITRLADAARDGSLPREDLSGSTITITSLGPLGALATTPIVNYPEVAILGVNRKQVRPHWDGRNFVPREMMNLSASLDHRIVDGWNAARFVARLKTLLETPALLFA
ncbi:dihydrolipoamide acetyltransferase family protein [Tropicimonas aquimaris]|uniref:Dihydrolipoamide acetyltransferase component of pyruvate dehydrogenase complex n=1 Tax=Tropicimonas aquimaris TaxID=914152 RepID=A0ABW3IPQ7_9RHOB